ncbi:MAG: phosphodiester glycosidase family protein, partial [Planctomycetes bacterium]|nr:phosphodiester glycosidase family protein [Planctomycetota bacterium]
VYTPQYGSTTGSVNSGVEELVEMTRPVVVVPLSEAPVGTIRQVRQNAGSTQIPFDHVVLSATGTRATTLLAEAHVGDRVGISFPFIGTPIPFTKTYASLGGGEVFMGDGHVWGGQAVRHPRTAIAYNDDYLYFVVVDGRSSISVGMTMTELGNFCKDYLDAKWGINQDGGGSSTMIVNGVLKNKPSDGSQRAVVNGIFMGTPLAKQQSTAFSSGDLVRTTSANNALRLGPGTQYTQIATLGNNAQATILDHHLRGIYAKSIYWWKCDFNGTVGWMSQNLLTLVSTGDLPRFTQHPPVRQVCPGTNAAFSVTATGTAPLSYAWLFQGSPIGDGAKYAGAATSTLTVLTPTSVEAGSYRCEVTGPTGTTTSYSARLRVRRSTQILLQPQPPATPRVPRGSDVTFAIRAVGEGTLTYRWQKDGVNLSDSAKYSGTTTTMLTAHSVDTYDEGGYRCVVTATCGTLTSDSPVLTVLSTDFDRDNDVDQDDYGHLQACFTGPTIPQADPACQDANVDADTDQDVDYHDVAAFLQCFVGAGVPRPPGC